MIQCSYSHFFISALALSPLLGAKLCCILVLSMGLGLGLNSKERQRQDTYRSIYALHLFTHAQHHVMW